MAPRKKSEAITLPPDTLRVVDAWAQRQGVSRADAAVMLIRYAMKMLDMAKMGRRR